MKKQQVSKSEAEAWLMAGTMQHKTDLTAMASLVVDVLGGNHISMEFIDFLITISGDDIIKAEL